MGLWASLLQGKLWKHNKDMFGPGITKLKKDSPNPWGFFFFLESALAILCSHIPGIQSWRMEVWDTS